MFARMKRGAYLINTARAELVDRDAVVDAVTSGHLAGYAGDVWFPEPAPADHPWRTMPFKWKSWLLRQRNSGRGRASGSRALAKLPGSATTGRSVRTRESFSIGHQFHQFEELDC
ncbi:hypothetical protein P3T23_002292 [Paraburkholderia sp. GAS448]